MSMIGNYLRLPEAELQEVLQGRRSIVELLYPESEEDDLSSERHLDTDKTWHLTHFLLTGEAWDGPGPLANAVLGGTAVSDEDVGYGPARYLTPAEVQETNLALADISPGELWGRFDADQVRKADIYPSGWKGDDADRQYVFDYFGELKAFFAAAAQAGEAIILYIN